MGAGPLSWGPAPAAVSPVPFLLPDTMSSIRSNRIDVSIAVLYTYSVMEIMYKRSL